MSTRTHVTFGVLMLVGFLIPGLAAAQVLTLPAGGKIVETVELAPHLGSEGILVPIYAVPMDRRLVITDLLVTGSGCGHRFNRDRLLLFSLCIPAGPQTFAHTFATGITFEAGQTFELQNSSSGPAEYYLRGVLIQPPK